MEGRGQGLGSGTLAPDFMSMMPRAVPAQPTGAGQLLRIAPAKDEAAARCRPDVDGDIGEGAVPHAPVQYPMRLRRKGGTADPQAPRPRTVSSTHPFVAGSALGVEAPSPTGLVLATAHLCRDDPSGRSPRPRSRAWCRAHARPSARALLRNKRPMKGCSACLPCCNTAKTGLQQANGDMAVAVAATAVCSCAQQHHRYPVSIASTLDASSVP